MALMQKTVILTHLSWGPEEVKRAETFYLVCDRCSASTSEEDSVDLLTEKVLSNGWEFKNDLEKPDFCPECKALLSTFNR